MMMMMMMKVMIMVKDQRSKILIMIDDGGVQRKEGHSRLRTRTGSKIFRNETTREEVNKILH